MHRLPITENERWKAAFPHWVAAGLTLAVEAHFLLFLALPRFEAEGWGLPDEAMESILLPPEVLVPPPPDEIARPALPRVAAVDIGEDITIAKMSFAEAGVLALPPPPEAHEAAAEDRPPFIPFSVPPVLENAWEIEGLLFTLYPRPLKIAKVGGTVLLWLHIDEDGRVIETRIGKTSGYSLLDEAAIRVALEMRFRPALNRDRVTDVWLAQPIDFRI